MSAIQTIHLVGDSMMAYYPKYKFPQSGWGQQLKGFIQTDKIRVLNHALNGYSTKTYLASGKWDLIIKKFKAGDYVIIGLGHNDELMHKPRTGTTVEVFKKNLNKMVDDVLLKQSIPFLCTPIVRGRFKNDAFYDVHFDYPDAIREVARSRAVKLIDLHEYSMKVIIKLGVDHSKDFFNVYKPGQYHIYPEGINDLTHLNVSSSILMAKYVSKRLFGLKKKWP